MNTNDYTDDELHTLFHNDHEGAFFGYLSQSRHSKDKMEFLYKWLNPAPSDYILECGSSSGKTSIDLSNRSGCRCLGIDFDDEAIHISSAMCDSHFPWLKERCIFVIGDLETMEFDHKITKILMPDFTEHIPDRILIAILENIRAQFNDVLLYIYTPNRSHVFEILKHRNILLKNPSGHINVKTKNELIKILEKTGWTIDRNTWRCSSMGYVKPFELVLGPLPLVGKYFQRRIAIIAKPKPN